jgi:hypothetical protein
VKELKKVDDAHSASSTLIVEHLRGAEGMEEFLGIWGHVSSRLKQFDMARAALPSLALGLVQLLSQIYLPILSSAGARQKAGAEGGAAGKQGDTSRNELLSSMHKFAAQVGSAEGRGMGARNRKYEVDSIGRSVCVLYRLLGAVRGLDSISDRTVVETHCMLLFPRFFENNISKEASFEHER